MRRRKFISLLGCMAAAWPFAARAQQPPVPPPSGGSGIPGGADGNIQYKAGGAFAGLTDKQVHTRMDNFEKRVDVRDFGAVGNNITDDTAAIQAAIDFAYANGIQTVFIPAGQYKITSSLYLDPPGNLRNPANFGSPPNFHFSLSLVGVRGLTNQNNSGTAIRPTFNNTVALYLGPGQGMLVANINMIGPGGLLRSQQNSNGVGIGLTGTGGGHTRAMLVECGVVNFYTGFKTAANGNGTLGDSNTFIKCFTDNVHYGFWISGIQNFVNTFYDCNPNTSVVGLYTPVGAGGHVHGGNWSNNAGQAAAFPLSAISALTAVSSGNYFRYTFTARIGKIGRQNAYIGTLYNAYAIKTARFGIVPLFLTAYNSGTGAGTFSTLTTGWPWLMGQQNALVNTDFQAEVQAATLLHAAEMKTAFWGVNVTVRGGVHIENAYAPTTIFRQAAGFGGTPNSLISDLFFNYDPSLGDLKNDADGTDNKAKWYIQQSFPFIFLETGAEQNVTIQNCTLTQTTQEPLIIDQSNPTNMLNVRESNIYPVNGRTIFGGGLDPNINHPSRGIGKWDKTPYLSKNNKTRSDRARVAQDMHTSPTWGFRPAGYVRPILTPDEVTTLCGTLPAITFRGGNFTINYPLLYGGQAYSVNDYDPHNGQVYEVASNHKDYTYGQDLTTTNCPGLSWTYKGQSFCLYLDANSMSLMFPGLRIILNNGASDTAYTVDGVYPGLGYVTVGLLAGNKTTVFTGTTIKQQPFALQATGQAGAAPSTKTANYTVLPLDKDLIFNGAASITVTLPSASIYTGREIRLKTIAAQTVVSAASNVVPLAGGAAGTAILAATAGKYARLISNGSSWEIMEAN